MNSPYTTHYADAVAIAQTSVAAAITAVVWRWPLRPKPASLLLLAAVWLAATAPFEGALLTSLGAKLAPDHLLFVLAVSRVVAVAAFAFAQPRWLALPALAGAVALWQLSAYLKEFDVGLCVGHVAFFAFSHALYVRVTAPRAPATMRPVPGGRGLVVHDAALFVLATVLGGIVAVCVLHRFANSGDEWAYTYEADLFAHGMAYGEPPPCSGIFRNYWVFFYQGRTFAQYLPGWPLLMAPFQRFGIVWLASPFAFGALCVAVARLARRVAASDPAADARQIAWAGTLGGLATMLPVGVLLNAGSRFAHIPVAAAFAWAVECACAVATPGLSRRAQWLWGLGLGLATSLMLAIRHGDGATLGVGIFVVFAYWLVRRRVAWRSLAGGAISFLLVAGLTLVLLRLQIGEWFTSGYSITHTQHAGFKVAFSLPKPNEFKFGVTIDTGSYLWWPCAPALGIAGLVLARGRGMGIAVMLAIGCFLNGCLYVASEFGRGWDQGYGPRYQLISVVPMAVGGAVLLAPLVRDALRRTGPSLRQAGPAMLAIGALVSGVLRIAPLVYPDAHAEVYKRSTVHRLIAEQRLKHAVVIASWAPELEVWFEPWDLAQNLPTVKNPDVLIVSPGHGNELACGRQQFGDRKWYRAVGQFPNVQLKPEGP